MTSAKVGALLLVVACLPLAVLSVRLIPAGEGIPAMSTGSNPSAFVAGTVGHERGAFLQELTRIYVAQEGDRSPPEIVAGNELAPVPFLNQELKRRGVKWRVSKTSGLASETFDVS